ncbi:uncharacterized protein LOC134762297 [Penaeus indicus]|uniref:uncharacterized protein LOC134762297 n=1 Tax=Penaeus indicus TaxID=29960 RepID=UPI00300CEAEE
MHAQLGGWFAAPDDGRKLMCLDERFGIQAGKCVVLSFGINNEWSFEDDVEKLGCKVYAFDPTMGKEDHQRTPNIQFFKLGISDVEGEKKIGMNPLVTTFNFDKPFSVDRYENIVRRLGLEGRVIDYVKMDIELAELDVLRDLLDNSPRLLRNINQLAIEIHDDYRIGTVVGVLHVCRVYKGLERVQIDVFVGFTILETLRLYIISGYVSIKGIKFCVIFTRRQMLDIRDRDKRFWPQQHRKEILAIFPQASVSRFLHHDVTSESTLAGGGVGEGHCWHPLDRMTSDK